MRSYFFRSLLPPVLLVFLLVTGRCDPAAETPLAELPTIAERLRGGLQPAIRAQVPADFLKISPDRSTALRAVKEGGQANVLVSRSMLDLFLRLAKAKAIDDVKKHYFDEYVAKLGAHAPDQPWPELPDADNPRYRTLDVSNGELSNFVQMVGCTVAIELSHVYLGQLDAHRADLGDGTGSSKSLKSVLTDAEWEKSMQAGLQNSVKSSYAVEGLVVLFQALEKMPQRPAWADHLLPPNVKPRKAIRDAEKIQDRVLH